MSIAILRTFVERRREEDAIAKANKKKKASEGPGGARRGKSKRGGQQANVAQTSCDKEGINKPCDAGAGSSGNGVAGGDISVQSGANVEVTEKEANETQCCASEPGPSDSRAALGLPGKHEQAPEGRSGSTDKENATGGASSSGPAMAKGRGLAPLKVLEVFATMRSETLGPFGQLSMLKIFPERGSVRSALAAPNQTRRFASRVVGHGLVASKTAFILLKIRVLRYCALEE
jgi:hypothetical protein